jgi:hypothetical protein
VRFYNIYRQLFSGSICVVREPLTAFGDLVAVTEETERAAKRVRHQNRRRRIEILSPLPVIRKNDPNIDKPSK